MNSHPVPRFNVHPSVVFQLGESLITDSVQALIELIKNCYDADATYAKVTIDTAGTLEIQGASYSSDGGRIVVEDDGHGMDSDAIKERWLVLSNRAKRELKEAHQTTPGGRTPLGDKGLGRLGAQRLGDGLDVFTKKARSQAMHFSFAWSDFEKATTLAGVPVKLEEWPDAPRVGTRVVISALKDRTTWTGSDGLKRLEQELSQLISPYRAIRNFTVLVEADGVQLDLVEISESIREIAPIQYRLDFDGKVLRVKGRARLDFFRPGAAADAEDFALLAESDGGKGLFGFLCKDKRAATVGLRRGDGRKWFIEFGRDVPLEDVPSLAYITRDGETVPANPGAFFGEVDSFDLGSGTFRRQSVFDNLQEYRSRIKDLSGIRVYRDGFGIRVAHDWLSLGTQWTSAGSYYGLKPDNTLGYIALSARDNMVLEETTDREGFSDTPYFRNFYKLLEEFLRLTSDAHDFFRRGWTQFQKDRREKVARVEGRKTTDAIARDLRARLEHAEPRRPALTQARGRLEGALRRAAAALGEGRTRRGGQRDQEIALAQAQEALRTIHEEARGLLAGLDSQLGDLVEIKALGRVLDDRVDSLRLQMDEMYEAIALGLTAEALSHEIFQIADGLAKRARAVKAKLGRTSAPAEVALEFVENVKSSVMALRKQLSYLSPALRFVREQREDLSIHTFVADVRDFYAERLARNSIELEVECRSEGDFRVWINRGKLAQVFDNFILNSEYWLIEEAKAGRMKRGIIQIVVDRPFVRISDNGRGIDPSVEPVLFEPFVTAKGRGKGRGLGLFIVKQLLDSEGCHVGALPERNAAKRLYGFQIDLRGAIRE